MASNAATPVPAEAEQFPRKGAVQEVATCDRLWNRERQSLSQPGHTPSWPPSLTWTTQAWFML